MISFEVFVRPAIRKMRGESEVLATLWRRFLNHAGFRNAR